MGAADKLLGVIHAPDLLTSHDQTLLKGIMDVGVVALNKDSTLKEAAQAFARYRYRALTATDENGKLIGILPYCDVMNLKHHYLA